MGDEIQVQRLERLLRINLELNATTSLEPLLHQIVEAAAELADAESAGILLLDPEKDELRFSVVTLFADQLLDLPVPLDASIAGAAFTSGQPVLVPDSQSDPRYYAEIEQIIGYQAHSLLAVPIQYQDRRIGVLEVENKRDGQEFNQKDVEALTILAAQAAIAIENAHLVQALHQARNELETKVNERTAELKATNDSLREQVTERKQAEKNLQRREAILETLSFATESFLRAASWTHSVYETLARLGRATGASRVYVFENHPNQEGANDFRASQRYEWVAPGVKAQIDNPALQNFGYQEHGFQRWVEHLSRGQPIQGHVRDFPPSEQKILTSQQILSIVVVPIFVRQTWWGFMGFDACQQEREWLEPEVDVLKTAANLLSSAIQRRQATQALVRSNREKQRLREAEIIATERRRIAQEIHDGLAQNLAALRLRTRRWHKLVDSDPAQMHAEMNILHQVLETSLREVRRSIFALRPISLEKHGFLPALEKLTAGFEEHYRVRVNLHILGSQTPLSLLLEHTLFRLIQESLNNVGKHAQASVVGVSLNLTPPDNVTLLVQDDGQGFDLSRLNQRIQHKNLGLEQMGEMVDKAGGKLQISSQPGQGTQIKAILPLLQD